jgi:hypothetical protein
VFVWVRFESELSTFSFCFHKCISILINVSNKFRYQIEHLKMGYLWRVVEVTFARVVNNYHGSYLVMRAEH